MTERKGPYDNPDIERLREQLGRVQNNCRALYKQRNEARAEVDRLREALRYYANVQGGRRAKKALGDDR